MMILRKNVFLFWNKPLDMKTNKNKTINSCINIKQNLKEIFDLRFL